MALAKRKRELTIEAIEHTAQREVEEYNEVGADPFLDEVDPPQQYDIRGESVFFYWNVGITENYDDVDVHYAYSFRIQETNGGLRIQAECLLTFKWANEMQWHRNPYGWGQDGETFLTTDSDCVPCDVSADLWNAANRAAGCLNSQTGDGTLQGQVDLAVFRKSEKPIHDAFTAFNEAATVLAREFVHGKERHSQSASR